MIGTNVPLQRNMVTGLLFFFALGCCRRRRFHFLEVRAAEREINGGFRGSEMSWGSKCLHVFLTSGCVFLVLREWWLPDQRSQMAGGVMG